ncbi:MAG TPA: cytochrome c [Acidimicrobiia bacterium]|nr:cytochrome c [Acidimicrobiia bacterium]
MKTWAEGLVALGITLLLGAGLWLFSGRPLSAEPTDSSSPVSFDSEAAARGEALAAATGCLACHNIDETAGTGPGWGGLAGSEVTLVSGETIVADDAYLFNSIVDPVSQVVAGFEAVMPTTYSDSLSEAEIDDLVEYIKSLG